MKRMIVTIAGLGLLLGTAACSQFGGGTSEPASNTIPPPAGTAQAPTPPSPGIPGSGVGGAGNPAGPGAGAGQGTGGQM